MTIDPTLYSAGAFFVAWQCIGMLPLLTLPLCHEVRERLIAWFILPGCIGILFVIVNVLITQ